MTASAARANEIGRCRCPACESTRARLRVSAKQLAYVTCDTCNVQVFARSDRSDALLRALLVVEPAAAPISATPPAAQISAPVPKLPTVAPAARPSPATARSTTWGFLG